MSIEEERNERRYFIRCCIDNMIDALEANPTVTRGEIYDAIAQDLERRCREVISAAGRSNER
jgi:hypothetical protein